MTSELKPDEALQAGLKALKQRDYDGAIATFKSLIQTLSTTHSSKSHLVKAQMGLMSALEGKGQWQAALDLSKTLLQSPSTQVRAWVTQRLPKIEAALRTAPAEPISAPTADLSGFQPLTPSSPQSDLSGFQPLQPSPSDPKRVIKNTPPVETPPSQAQPPSTELPPAITAVSAESSLFHYSNLNQSGSASAVAGTTDPVSPDTLPTPSEPPVELPVVPEFIEPQQFDWPQAPGLKTGRSLGRVKPLRFWIAQCITAIALFWLLHWGLHTFLRTINGYLIVLDRIIPFQFLNFIGPKQFLVNPYNWKLLIFLVGLGIASPWLWDNLLQASAKLSPLKSQQLMPISPKAVQVARQICQQKNWPFPSLKRLDTDIPLIFSYGCLPRYGRLVISQGVLDRLSNEEIAALCAYELSHWQYLSWPLFSLQALLAHSFHQLYWRLATFGNTQPPIVKITCGILANGFYVVFWGIAKVGCWLSRMRAYFCDRNATELTGDPNALTRALTKLSLGLSQAIDQQGYTPPLLESLDLLLPVGANHTQTFAQRFHQSPLATPFAWDLINPYRSWLSFNQSHPPLGDRLNLLSLYARHWQLTPEIDFQPLLAQYRTNNNTAKRFSLAEWRTLALQAGPWSGLAIGYAIGISLWGLGFLGRVMKWPFFDWIYRDMGVLRGAILLGLGAGLLLRMNPFFPDLRPQQPNNEDELTSWLEAPDLIPLDSLPAKFSGTLIGRPGLANWLGQDLLLKTQHGLLKLHFFSYLGILGNALPFGEKPIQYLQKPVQILGWFRRGHTPWLDIDYLFIQSKQRMRGGHPLWSTGILGIAILWGLWNLVGWG
jgi:Zn-dependent protease with chaperone function